MYIFIQRSKVWLYIFKITILAKLSSQKKNLYFGHVLLHFYKTRNVELFACLNNLNVRKDSIYESLKWVDSSAINMCLQTHIVLSSSPPNEIIMSEREVGSCPHSSIYKIVALGGRGAHIIPGNERHILELSFCISCSTQGLPHQAHEGHLHCCYRRQPTTLGTRQKSKMGVKRGKTMSRYRRLVN